MYARGRGLSIERRVEASSGAAADADCSQVRRQIRTHAGTKHRRRAPAEDRTARLGRRTPHAARHAVRADGAPACAPAAVVEGIVSANRAGYGFLRVEGSKDSVFLPPPRDARRHARRSPAGEGCARTAERPLVGHASSRSLERGVTAFLGTVEVQGRSAWVNAADRRLQLRCAVAAR